MTPSFSKTYIIFKSCILFPSWYLVIFTSKYFYNKNFQVLSCCCFSVSGKTGRPARSTGACVRTCTLVHVCRPTAGSTDRLQCCSRVFWVDRPVDRLQKTVFLFRGRSTRAVDPSPTATASRADGRPDRSTARPAEPQRLFPLLCYSEICFLDCFLADFFWVFGDLFQSK